MAENSQAVTTPAARVSYPHVFKMRSYNDGAPSYSVRVMLDKKNKEHMEFMKKLVGLMKDVAKRQWPDEKTRPRIPLYGHDKSPIKDGDKNCNQQGIPFKERNPEVEGHFFFNAAKYDEPLIVVDRNREELVNSNAIYGGCICKINMNCYARVRKDNPGISFGLNGVQYWDEGERLGSSRANVDSMFEAAEADENDPMNFENEEFDTFSEGGALPEDDDITF